MKHPEHLSWADQDYFREILQEEQMASQVRVQSAWSENRRELCEKYLDVIIKKLKNEREIDVNIKIWIEITIESQKYNDNENCR